MKARVTQKGFIFGHLANPGDIINVTEEQFAAEWMEKLEEAPEAPAQSEPAKAETVEPVKTQAEQLAAASQGVLTDPAGGSAPATVDGKSEAEAAAAKAAAEAKTK